MKKGKSLFKIIVVNVIILFLLLISIDFLSAFFRYKENLVRYRQRLEERGDYTQKEYNSPQVTLDYSLQLHHFKKIWEKYKTELKTEKRLSKGNGNKKSIVVLGCSFAEGIHLSTNETFEAQLSKKTNRTVYNRGYSGFGMAEALWLTKQNDFYENIDTEPEYVVYIYIADHLNRIFRSKYAVGTNVHLSFSKNPQGHLVEVTPWNIQFARFSMFKNYKEKEIAKRVFSSSYNDEYFDVVKLYFEEIRNEIRRKYPNIKFIIIKHPTSLLLSDSKFNEIDASTYSYITPRWSELEADGFIIYDIKDRLKEDVINKEYTVYDGHPNAKTWELVVNKLVKDLKIN